MSKRDRHAAPSWETLRTSYLAILTRQQREVYLGLPPEQQREILRSYVLDKARALNPRFDQPARRRSIWRRIAGRLSGR